MKQKLYRLALAQIDEAINPKVTTIATALDSGKSLMLIFNYDRILGIYSILNGKILLHSTSDQLIALDTWHSILESHDMLIMEKPEQMNYERSNNYR